MPLSSSEHVHPIVETDEILVLQGCLDVGEPVVIEARYESQQANASPG